MNDIWASKGWKARLLLPVSFVFQVIVWLRSRLYRTGILKVNKFAVPVIVVGNISVGGTGKTPIVSALVKRLIAAGLNPGIVSRGYGAMPAKLPRLVNAETAVELSGDEPLLLAIDTGVPVCICSERSAAVEWLITNEKVDIVVSDDGLQHYAMHRDIEIAVVDGQRKLGNGWLLPAGPLREPPHRLHQANIVAVQQTKHVTESYLREVIEMLSLDTAGAQNSGHFYLGICALRNLHSEQIVELATMQGQKVHAVAGLGNPQRFFASLTAAGLDLVEHAFPDHHRYVSSDITFDDQHPVLVTSKDAVKIRGLNADLTRTFEVPVVARLDQNLDNAINELIAKLA